MPKKKKKKQESFAEAGVYLMLTKWSVKKDRKFESSVSTSAKRIALSSTKPIGY